MPKFSAAIVAAVLSASMMAHAQSVTSISNTDNETADRWLVELSSAPTIDGTDVAALEQEEVSFHAAAAAAGITYRESKHFRELFNGLTVRATGRDVARLRALPGVRAVYPDVKFSVSQQEMPPGNVADLVTALAQTGADVAQSALRLTGRGVRVAVIDTGVDYDHPDLGGGFGPGTRVTEGFDFVGDAFNADDEEPIVMPDPDPDDCNGHGTHVAGIIGANGGLTGVAPGVTFHAYRVFGCEGTTTTDIMLEAMERAHRDGADVVNMSIGAALQWPQYPTAQAADRLVRRGIVVVSSAGNEGVLGLYASLSYMVVQRRPELAVRLAVGADARAILRLVVGEGLLTAAFGVVTGAVASLLLGRILQNQVYGVSTSDPLTLAVIALTLGVATIAACAVPGLRAARTDAALALRE